jgi:hypothetical protein
LVEWSTSDLVGWWLTAAATFPFPHSNPIGPQSVPTRSPGFARNATTLTTVVHVRSG